MAYTAIKIVAKGKKEGWFLEGSDPYGLLYSEADRVWGWAQVDSGKDTGVIGYSEL